MASRMAPVETVPEETSLKSDLKSPGRSLDGNDNG
jgi:hypothetical protein